jgi:hypothetical protein
VSDTDFRPFGKIARLNRDVVVTEKIDGTNALVFVGNDGTVRAGSRTRWITPVDDNFGFAAWVASNEEHLRALGPGHHYGEWWGQGIQRRYALGMKRFSLFNVGRWNKENLPFCCDVVPTLGIGPMHETVTAALEDLRRNGSKAAPGFNRPEGIVAFHTHSGSLFKVTLEKDEASKGRAA